MSMFSLKHDVQGDFMAKLTSHSRAVKNCQGCFTKEREMESVLSKVNPKASESLREPGPEMCWKAWSRLNQLMDLSLRVGYQVH